MELNKNSCHRNLQYCTALSLCGAMGDESNLIFSDWLLSQRILVHYDMTGVALSLCISLRFQFSSNSSGGSLLRSPAPPETQQSAGWRL